MKRKKTYKTLAAAFRDMPACISTCDDPVGIEIEARRNRENPLAILRDLVRTELDLIEEGEIECSQVETKAVRDYWSRLCESVNP